MHRPCCTRRRDTDNEAVWMSGFPKSIFFWVLQRHNIHREVELMKVAGEYKVAAPTSHRASRRRGETMGILSQSAA